MLSRSRPGPPTGAHPCKWHSVSLLSPSGAPSQQSVVPARAGHRDVGGRGRTRRGQGGVHHRGRPGTGAQPCRPAGRGGRRHHRHGRARGLPDRPVPAWPPPTTSTETVRLVEALDGASWPARPTSGIAASLGHCWKAAWHQLGRLDIVERQRRHLQRPDLGRGDPRDSGRTPSTPISPACGTPGGRGTPPDRQRWRVDHRHRSTAGIKGVPFLSPYVAAKHGVVGIARSLANELARHRIRVNTVHPAGREHADARWASAAWLRCSSSTPTSGASSRTRCRSPSVEARDVERGRALPGLRRVPLRHRPRVHRRRRSDHPMTRTRPPVGGPTDARTGDAAVSNPWFETVAEAQRRAKRRLPTSVYTALVAGSEKRPDRR